ncbi:MAG: DUF3137 domain-containing protein [Oscillospiraceae bacterium]|nr:DUF3137 domain-containing protein [Oscillospiraceae bacterium]
MEQTTSFCHLCGALLKRRTRRCSSCGSAVNRSTTTPEPKSAPQVARPSSGDAALFEKLQPLQVEKDRHQRIGGAIFVVALAVTFIFSIGEIGLGIALGVLGMIAGGAFFYISTLFITEEKKALISTHIVQGMLADNFELVRYLPKETFTEGQLKRSQLRGWNAHIGNDWFQAEYKGITFSFSDVKLMSEGRDWTPFFKGQWFIVDLHKEMAAPLIISELERRGALGRGARIQIEQKPFGDIFTVLTESPSLIPQVLTPDFMEFLVAIRHSLSHTEIHLFFDGEQAQKKIYLNPVTTYKTSQHSVSGYRQRLTSSNELSMAFY